MPDERPDFARIYDLYSRHVRAYAARLIGRDEAEDVAQEVFVKIQRARETLEDPTRLSAWIHAITLNTVRDVARRHAARPPLALGDQDEAEERIARAADSRSRTPEEMAIREEMIGCYLEFVRQLPARYLEVYTLSEFEDLPNVEIAKRLSLSLETVKIRLHRARSRLHDALRRNCQCYYNDRGELMGERKPEGGPPPRRT